MSIKPPYNQKIGYTRREFGAIFQLYSQNVYSGLFKDFSFLDMNGKYYISFREEAGKTPLVTIEKRKVGPERVLFIATTPSKNGPKEIARSEKIDSFIAQLKGKIEILRSVKNKSDFSSKSSNLNTK
jgi:hypothetical protein